MVIFGGTGGLGTEMSERFHEKYNVISLGSKDCDVSSFAECKDFFSTNNTDIVINLSGVNFDKFIHKLDETDESSVDNILDINIKGSVNIIATCLPAMRKNQYGRIILTSSVLATKNVMGTALYSGCKAFIDKLAQNVSAENIGKGITVNSVQLGYFDAGLVHRIPKETSATIRSSIGLRRWGSMEEFERTLQYIIATEYLTGASIRIDGGL